MSDADRRRRLLLLIRIVPGLFLLVIALAGTELFARRIYGKPSMHFGLEMWKYAKTLKLRAEDPEMSHRHRPNAEAFLMGVDVKINSLGLRDHEISVQKPAGTYRIVVLGDSTTFGWGVPFEQTYPKLIEKSLNARPPAGGWTNYEVINTGIGNYNTAQELASLKDRWLVLKPDMVLIGWYINDAEPTPRPSYNWLAYHSYGYIWITSNFDALRRNLGAGQNYKQYYEGLYDDKQPGWPKCQAAFAELARLCKDRNTPLHVLLIPELHTLSGNYEFTHIDDLIRQIGIKNGVSVLDLIEAFPADGDPKQYWASPEDDHPNGKANELMAAKIEDVLRRDQWIK
jgi:lysophospholipase L1-like esterase